MEKSTLFNGTSSEDEGNHTSSIIDSAHKMQNTNSQCSSMSDGESFECYGEGDMDSLPPVSPHNPNNSSCEGQFLDIKRNTWLRTSLRRSPAKNNESFSRKWGSLRQPSGKRISSNALASHLYRSSSFNSSGQSSNCENTDEVYSDVSLEEDVLDLTHKFRILEEQMNALADKQTNSDERYTRAKQENATLQSRIIVLEEQLREVELRSDEKLCEEAKRHRELVARVDREKQLQVENCAIKLQSLESDNNKLQEELTRYRKMCENHSNENEKLRDKLDEFQCAVTNLEDEVKKMRDQDRKYKEEITYMERLIGDLQNEVETLRREKTQIAVALNDCKETPSQIETELNSQLDGLRQEHKNLRDEYEELQALLLTRGINEGRSLLNNSNSLAVEMGQLNQDDARAALKEQQEVNTQLRTYIDNILLSIVDNYPQLLEVKRYPIP